ncbi:MAG: hypothetical protein DI551_00405 [Micavibrio aeruginosavorus]|uniref:Type 4 secretion system PilS N-terminal domain-containing protein n=1 Tax=Micavibrio aeruginosavorus TaxID=349221 RepID=A0A2W5PWD8_9BACT|nr:MAG: hypothetical protein DI551_00405 [Micavibrio aeruginosavorus]
MIYILLALALLGGLTMLLGRQNNDGENLNQEQAELLTTGMTAYVGTAKNVVDQMLMSGATVNDLSFTKPNHPSFDNEIHRFQVYHPDGGGFSTDTKDSSSLFAGTGGTPPNGWYMGRFNNVDWTPSSEQDVFFTALGITQAVCENINKKITGSSSIPAVADATKFFVDDDEGGSGNADFADTDCTDCEGYPSLCVSTDSGARFIYYNIIEAR